MQHRIARAKPRRDGTVEVWWHRGPRTVVDFKPWIAKGGIFAPLAEPSFFVGMMHVHWDGYSLGWPGELDFSAEGLWLDGRATRAKRARKAGHLTKTKAGERQRARAA
jgi:hypothetical protein